MALIGRDILLFGVEFTVAAAVAGLVSIPVVVAASARQGPVGEMQVGFCKVHFFLGMGGF